METEKKQMNYTDARAWLSGERSTVNMVPEFPTETRIERIARADAACMEQAYWVLRATLLTANMEGRIRKANAGEVP